MDIRWHVSIIYTTIVNKRLSTEYYINASNADKARNLANELFLMEYGVFDDVKFEIEPQHLTSDDMKIMLDVKDTIFSKLNDIFKVKNYKSFVLAFQDFEGYNAHISSIDDSYFWLNFMGMKVKAVYKVNDVCYIDSKEVYYVTETGRRIVARNSWTEFYYYV